jgi:hypothetical protein
VVILKKRNERIVDPKKVNMRGQKKEKPCAFNFTKNPFSIGSMLTGTPSLSFPKTSRKQALE